MQAPCVPHGLGTQKGGVDKIVPRGNCNKALLVVPDTCKSNWVELGNIWYAPKKVLGNSNMRMTTPGSGSNTPRFISVAFLSRKKAAPVRGTCTYSRPLLLGGRPGVGCRTSRHSTPSSTQAGRRAPTGNPPPSWSGPLSPLWGARPQLHPSCGVKTRRCACASASSSRGPGKSACEVAIGT